MTPEQMKLRLALVEDEIGQINQRMIFQEGRAYAFEQALLGMIEVFGVDQKVFTTVQKYLHEGRVAALNSTESEIKVEAAEQVSQLILQLMTTAVKRNQEVEGKSG